MISLNRWINTKNEKPTNIDGHIHLFDKHWSIMPEAFACEKNVGFIDIEPKYIDDYKKCMYYYDRYIANHYDPERVILLASSVTPSEMIKMHQRWPKIIKGFGEIKCYHEWNDEILGLDKLSLYTDVFKYADEHKLPVYIHYTLKDKIRVKRFTNLLKRFPNVKFVLCHCGMDEFMEDKDFAFYNVSNIMTQYFNIYVDISYIALDYFHENPLRLNALDKDRIILGSDINGISTKNNKNDLKKDLFFDLACYINNDENINRLFNL